MKSCKRDLKCGKNENFSDYPTHVAIDISVLFDISMFSILYVEQVIMFSLLYMEQVILSRVTKGCTSF